MSKMENIEKKLEQVNELANEVSRRANKELSIAKHKITCLTILIVLFAVIGACIAFYSIHSMKELFYNMTVEEEVVETIYEQDIDAGDGGNATGIIGDSNEVNN